VGTAFIKGAVTVGVNVPLTFGKETNFTETSAGMFLIWRTLKD
jgi:hypothetical protein